MARFVVGWFVLLLLLIDRVTILVKFFKTGSRTVNSILFNIIKGYHNGLTHD